MTTGNYTRDTRYTWPGSSVKAGYLYTKTWSGADRPITKPVRTKYLLKGPWFEPIYMKDRVFLNGPIYKDDVDGSYKGGKLRYRPGRGRIVGYKYHRAEYFRPRDYVTPPVRDDTPHAYTAAITSKYLPPDVYLSANKLQWYTWNVDPLYQSTLSWNQAGSNDDIALLGKLREKVVGSGFNLGVVFAELPQTIRLIADTASRIDRAYTAVRKGRFETALRYLYYGSSSVSKATAKANAAYQRRVNRLKVLSDSDRRFLKLREWQDYLRIGAGTNLTVPKALAQNVLEVQYGWRPLIGDVIDGAKFLAHRNEVPLKEKYVVRRKRKGTLLSGSPSLYHATVGTEEIRGQLIAYLKEVKTLELTGLADPASVIWEKLPFSFVADWFIPIGNYLQARALAPSLTGTYVKTITYRQSAVGITPTNSTYRYQRGPFADFRHRYITVARTVSYSGFSVPLPSFKSLMPSSWQHCLNAVALLVSNAKSMTGSRFQR